MSGTNSLIIGYNSAYIDQFVNGSFFVSLGGNYVARFSNEQSQKALTETALTLSNLAVRIGGTNTYGAGAASQVLRKNGATGNSSAAVGGAGTNVWVVDATHSDSLAVADLYCSAFVANSGGPDCNVGMLQAQANSSTPAVPYLISSNGGVGSGWNTVNTCYMPLFGSNNQGQTSESVAAQTPIRAAGTLSGFTCTATGLVGSATSRKNAGAGNASLTFSGSNGSFADATHSDAIASGDTFDTKLITSAPGAYVIAYGFAGSTSKHDLASAQDPISPASSSTYFTPFGGILSLAETTETPTKQVLPYALTASNLRVVVSANTAGTLTLTSRKNAGAGNQSVSVSLLATGVIEDATHTDSYAANDALNGQFATGAGVTISIGSILISVNDGSNTGTSTETGTAALAFGGVGFAGSASDTRISAGALNFLGVAFSASASDFTARAALAFGGVSFAGAAADARVSAGAMAFGGVAFAGVDGVAATARIAEAFVSDLVTMSAGARIAEAFVSDLVVLSSGARIQEAFVSALVYRGPCATRRCQVWTIARRDGVVLGFTSLDRDIDWRGVTYRTCKSLSPSASESSAELRGVGNAEVIGILDDAAIAEADLYAGLYDDATVEAWVICWDDGLRDPQTPFCIMAGKIGKVTREEHSFTAEVLGAGAQLQQAALVDFVTPGCRWSFGVLDDNGIGCPVDVEALKLAGVAVTGARGRSIVNFVHAAPGGAPVWNQGRLRWLTGRNAGVVCQVETVDFAAGALSLWDLAPFPPLAGETFDLLPGCPKTKAQCKAYAAYLSFGGYSDIPGPDALQSNADSLFT